MVSPLQHPCLLNLHFICLLYIFAFFYLFTSFIILIMSHQTGITASSELCEFLAASKDGQIRLMKIGIDNEKLVLVDKTSPKGSWQDDWDAQLLCRLEDQQPCYIFYRLDHQTDLGFEWIFISYSPDCSPVRQKMLYAATRATLKMQFGGGQLRDELFATTPGEVCLASFKRRVVSRSEPQPMTLAEEELEQIKLVEVNVDVSVDTKHQTLQGVAFPLTSEANTQLDNLVSGTVNYVQLCINVDTEVITAEVSDNVDVRQLRTMIPRDHARYHFYRFKHIHEGDQLNSIVFIYSVPGYNCPIKERMLYSACKSALLEQVHKQFTLEIARRIEMDDPKELTSEFLYDELHPKTNIVKQQFARPKGPTARGPKRIVRNLPATSTAME